MPCLSGTPAHLRTPLYPSPITTLRPIRTAPGEDGHAWAAALSDPAWESRARILKRDATTTVHRATILGRDVVIKTWRPSAGAKFKSLLAASRAHRHWRGAAWLATHGFRTATCYALLAGPRAEVLIMEALAGKSVLHHLADRDLTVKQEHAIARELGRLLARLERAGRANRDGKPSNLIVTRLEPVPEVAVIDCVAIRRAGGTWDSLDRSAARLLIEPRGVGFPVRRTLCAAGMRAIADAFPPAGKPYPKDQRRRDRRETWETVARIIRDHGDPTPRVSPL